MTQSVFRIAMLLTSLLGVALAATSSQAGDGVIEINQARALAGGVSATDTPGFPVTIDTAGSYALTGDLSVSNLNANGIVVTVADVTLDLRGFTIQGGCPPTGCTSGSGSGIVASQTGSQVRNGRVRRFPGYGVSIGARSRISGLVAERNGDNGITSGNQTDIVDSTAVLNTRYGIEAGSQSKIRNCVADSNVRGGISLGSHSILSDSSARSNAPGVGASYGQGIVAGTGTLLQGNLANGNVRLGIDIEGAGALVIDNVVVANGSYGIYSTGPGSFQRNTANDNGGAGMILFGSGVDRSAYRDNVANGNSGGSIGGGTNIGGNSCNGTATCP